MIDLSLMSKQEKIIIISLLVAIFLLLVLILTPANFRQDKKVMAPANILSSGGGPGEGNGYFQTPRDIVVDKEGNIYIVDSRNHRIQKFSSEGVFLTTWGKEGDKPGQFKEPCGIDIGPDGNIYVADTWNGRVQIFDSTGKFIKEFGKERGMWGPRDLAVDRDGNIYVCDTGWCKIEKFDKNGVYITTFGKKGGGTLPGEFKEPFGIKQGPDGNLYVIDRKNFRIQILTTEGKFIKDIKIDGWSEKQIDGGCLMEPYLDIDSKRGLIYVTDSTNHRVLRYNLNGKDKKIFLKDERGMNMFACPLSVAVAGDGRILVTDAGVAKIITFIDKN